MLGGVLLRGKGGICHLGTVDAVAATPRATNSAETQRQKAPGNVCVGRRWQQGTLKPNAAPHTGIYRKQHLHKRIQQPQPPNGHQQMS